MAEVIKEEEYILCAAIHFDDGNKYVHQPKNIQSGYVLCGRRHHNIYAVLAGITGNDRKRLEYEQCQGFITNLDRFVDREEGYLIALNAKQIKDIEIEPELQRIFPDREKKRLLISEHLY